jgi:hypothetical protein
MAELTLEEIIQAIKKLDIHQKALLLERLEPPLLDVGFSREELIEELEVMRASGVFAGVESLRNMYANLSLDDLTDEQLSDTILQASTAWEQELDDFFGDEP